MFQRARLKLTFLYSLIFLFLFWSLSAGVYLWMNKYFGDTGIDRYIHTNSERFFNGRKEERNEPPSDIILDELRDTLVIIDALLFFIVPTLAWFLREEHFRQFNSRMKERNVSLPMLLMI